MGWYIVVKTIKGHRYRYRQRTWREGARVRCESVYMGAADGTEPVPSKGKRAVVVNTTGVEDDAGGEERLVEALFDPANSDKDWILPWRHRYSASGRRFDPDKRLYALTTAMGVTGISRPWKGNGRWVGGDGAWYRPSEDTVQIPEASRFEDAEGFAMALLHELTHATRDDARVGRRKNNRAEEEVVAELGANLVAHRLGLRGSRLGQSAYYVQTWLARCVDEEKSRAFAEREARRAADYILQKWQQVNTTK